MVDKHLMYKKNQFADGFAYGPNHCSGHGYGFGKGIASGEACVRDCGDGSIISHGLGNGHAGGIYSYAKGYSSYGEGDGHGCGRGFGTGNGDGTGHG